jgi:hypothetical protein
MDQMLDGASAELQELVADLSHQVKLQKTKLKQRKEESEKLKVQIQENQHQHAALVVSMKRSNQQLSTELSNKTQKLEDLQRMMTETHGQQIDDLVNHNQKLLQQQHAVMSSIPQSLMFNTKLLQDAQKANEKITLEERIKFSKELKALEFGRQAEIQNIKQQYEVRVDRNGNIQLMHCVTFSRFTSLVSQSLSTNATHFATLFSPPRSLVVVLVGQKARRGEEVRLGFQLVQGEKERHNRRSRGRDNQALRLQRRGEGCGRGNRAGQVRNEEDEEGLRTNGLFDASGHPRRWGGLEQHTEDHGKDEGGGDA